VVPENGDMMDVVGWITMDNQSGHTFKQARIKLMAGDVNKIQNVGGFRRQADYHGSGGGGGAGAPPVTEKTFDEYHLYTLERQTTLREREKKQVEFVRAGNVKSETFYVYDGAKIDENWNYLGLRTDYEYGVQCNRKVWVMREFTNSVANHLGLPLPKGRVRLYRRNTDGQMEFTGENVIEHTPRDEVIRLNTGNSFDLVGERNRIAYRINLFNANNANVPSIDPATGLVVAPSKPTDEEPAGPWIVESFEITLRNHKQNPVLVRVVEHLYRWSNWQIKEKSDDFRKTDSQTIEFGIPLKPDEERKVTYTVHYSW
jgi:hypothetical protein